MPTNEEMLADADFLELLGKAAENRCGKYEDWPGFKVIAHVRELIEMRQTAEKLTLEAQQDRQRVTDLMMAGAKEMAAALLNVTKLRADLNETREALAGVIGMAQFGVQSHQNGQEKIDKAMRLLNEIP